ncbi:DUF1566 domain-containing protein [Desulfobotulus sp.]|jgi:hypothetical protein|uniref:Lcl C-terminal domain-containing protein n=1 Tax=Desulfobotulus sp. TaxID=1940337 RepID=UPI002A366F0F|nr:DUF1566 domain-containing protein [Desulfobotulus sp.]MDY0163291.1 DUF1566 domain-containing protein [Desulfobotulus sp.]
MRVQFFFRRLMVLLVLLLVACTEKEEYGVLHIVSQPGDAQIFINGERRGNTPEIESRAFTIRLKKGFYRIEGYRPIDPDMEYYGVREDLFVGANTEQHLWLRMEKRLTEKGMANAALLYMERAFADRYHDLGNGTIMDFETGLQWMRCSVGQQWDGESCLGVPQAHTWAQATEAARGMNVVGGYAGKKDWRLPSVEELQSLVFCSSGYPEHWNNTGRSCEGEYRRPAILEAAFPNTPSTWFWTGEEDAEDPQSAWFVFFHYGSSQTGKKHNEKYLRFVRDGGL